MKRILIDIIWIFLNCFINRIPFWTVRKMVYLLFKMSIGKGARVGINTIIINPWSISIGQNTIVNENCYLDGRGGLTIGSNTSISIYSRILTASHNIDDEFFEYTKNRVLIGDNCFIGMSALILPNSTINKGVVLGAGCVFFGEGVEHTVYVGNPRKELRKRKSKANYKLDSIMYFK